MIPPASDLQATVDITPIIPSVSDTVFPLREMHVQMVAFSQSHISVAAYLSPSIDTLITVLSRNRLYLGQ